jgi:hypothetical protein
MLSPHKLNSVYSVMSIRPPGTLALMEDGAAGDPASTYSPFNLRVARY